MRLNLIAAEVCNPPKVQSLLNHTYKSTVTLGFKLYIYLFTPICLLIKIYFLLSFTSLLFFPQTFTEVFENNTIGTVPSSHMMRFFNQKHDKFQLQIV